MVIYFLNEWEAKETPYTTWFIVTFLNRESVQQMLLSSLKCGYWLLRLRKARRDCASRMSA